MRKGGRRDFLGFNSFTLHWEVTLGNDAFYVLCVYFCILHVFVFCYILAKIYLCVC